MRGRSAYPNPATTPSPLQTHRRSNPQRQRQTGRSVFFGFQIRIFKDPVSSWTHFVGFWLALAAVAVLVLRVAGDGPKSAAMAIYGATLVMLFLASSLYHWLDIGAPTEAFARECARRQGADG